MFIYFHCSVLKGSHACVSLSESSRYSNKISLSMHHLLSFHPIIWNSLEFQKSPHILSDKLKSTSPSTLPLPTRSCYSCLGKQKEAAAPSALFCGRGIPALWRSAIKKGRYTQSAPLWSQGSFPGVDTFSHAEIAYAFPMKLQREIIETLNKKM